MNIRSLVFLPYFFIILPFDLKSYLIPERQKFVLLTSLYNEHNYERYKEYLFCLKKNINHPLISHVHVIYDVTKDKTKDEKNLLLNYLKEKNIEITYSSGRPTFGFLFDLINQRYQGRKIILTNADIYFDDSLYLLQDYDFENKFLSLTRWDINKNGKIKPAFRENAISHKNHYGADTWIFKSPIIRLTDEDFSLGSWGCDGRLIYQVYKSKLQILNPCKDVKCCHMHLSEVRNYSADASFVKDKAMAWVVAGYLGDQKATVHILQE